MAFRPIGAKIADYKGYKLTIVLGMFLLAAGLFLVDFFVGHSLLVLAIFIGIGQGLIFPASVALLAEEANKNYQGTTMGVYGSLRNIGKVLGPVCAGFGLANYNFSIFFMALAVIILITTIIVVLFWNIIARKNIL